MKALAVTHFIATTVVALPHVVAVDVAVDAPAVVRNGRSFRLKRHFSFSLNSRGVTSTGSACS